MSPSTVFFALLAAALFGMTVHLQRRGLDHLPHLSGTLVSLGTVAAIFWLLAPFAIEAAWWHTRAAAIFALCGLVFPALSQHLQLLAVARLGPSLGSAMSSMAPVFAAVPAVILLGETLSLRLFAAICLMVAAAAVSSMTKRGIARHWPLWAIGLPVGASFFRGIVQPAGKVGLDEVPSPFFSVLVMVSVSVPVVIALRWGVGRSTRPRPNARPREGRMWFALNGLCAGFGILSMQTALQSGQVVVAAPLVSTTPLWTLLFGWLVFRSEPVGARHVATAALVMAGVLLIVAR